MVSELVVQDRGNLAIRRHVMAVMGREGDVKQLWDPANPDEVAVARKVFDDLKKKGFVAYTVEGAKGKKGTVLTAFDPQAGRIIMAPAMAGG